MAQLFFLLFGMLVAGAGVATGIILCDRSHERRTLKAQCSMDE